TSGLSRTLSWWSPDELVSYNGALWELQPVEVTTRAAPTASAMVSLAAPEQAVFNDLGKSIAALQTYLRERDLALIVGRNMTTRDSADIQQPFNLKVDG